MTLDHFKPPQPIQLTDSERQLWQVVKGFDSEPRNIPYTTMADAMENLFISLNERKAIPEIRLKIFTDPEYAEAGSKSPLQYFESNGTVGREVIRHGNFIKYLEYMVFGPAMPQTVQAGLCRILNEDRGTSGMVQDAFCKYVRHSVRSLGPGDYQLPTAFFRLAVEIGMTIDQAKLIRKEAKSVRK